MENNQTKALEEKINIISKITEIDPNTIVSKLQEIAESEDGEQTLALISQATESLKNDDENAQQAAIMLTQIFKPNESQLFKVGGKLNYLVNKFGEGGVAKRRENQDRRIAERRSNRDERRANRRTRQDERIENRQEWRDKRQNFKDAKEKAMFDAHNSKGYGVDQFNYAYRNAMNGLRAAHKIDKRIDRKMLALEQVVGPKNMEDNPIIHQAVKEAFTDSVPKTSTTNVTPTSNSKPVETTTKTTTQTATQKPASKPIVKSTTRTTTKKTTNPTPKPAAKSTSKPAAQSTPKPAAKSSASTTKRTTTSANKSTAVTPSNNTSHTSTTTTVTPVSDSTKVTTPVSDSTKTVNTSFIPDWGSANAQIDSTFNSMISHANDSIPAGQSYYSPMMGVYTNSLMYPADTMVIPSYQDQVNGSTSISFPADTVVFPATELGSLPPEIVPLDSASNEKSKDIWQWQQNVKNDKQDNINNSRYVDAVEGRLNYITKPIDTTTTHGRAFAKIREKIAQERNKYLQSAAKTDSTFNQTFKFYPNMDDSTDVIYPIADHVINGQDTTYISKELNNLWNQISKDPETGLAAQELYNNTKKKLQEYANYYNKEGLVKLMLRNYENSEPWKKAAYLQAAFEIDPVAFMKNLPDGLFMDSNNNVVSRIPY